MGQWVNSSFVCSWLRWQGEGEGEGGCSRASSLFLQRSAPQGILPTQPFSVVLLLHRALYCARTERVVTHKCNRLADINSESF